ncbi:hypothetical protein BO71DRAFT_427062 [Aspergillus ellipticus CBS 707.79]|uniref:Uncharacterized protein n=1 Tax=Aspergillus ellipticus CBS 707.79 TaxID=1448320 RepID=A0A319E104_9EURO|nr:hypothetical protein BO71DRAFT_427062 [Aspergillus ellipticus CBS 707.79]
MASACDCSSNASTRTGTGPQYHHTEWSICTLAGLQIRRSRWWLTTHEGSASGGRAGFSPSAQRSHGDREGYIIEAPPPQPNDNLSDTLPASPYLGSSAVRHGVRLGYSPTLQLKMRALPDSRRSPGRPDQACLPRSQQPACVDNGISGRTCKGRRKIRSGVDWTLSLQGICDHSFIRWFHADLAVDRTPDGESFMTCLEIGSMPDYGTWFRISIPNDQDSVPWNPLRSGAASDRTECRVSAPSPLPSLAGWRSLCFTLHGFTVHGSDGLALATTG